eukprot:gene14655-20689_t
MDETGANILHTVEGAVDGAPPRIPTTHIPPPKLTSHILNEAEFEVPVSKARSVADTEDIVTEKSYTYSHQSRGALSTMSSHHPHSHYAPSVAGGSSKYPDEKSTAWDLNLKEHHGNGASGQMPALYALRHNLAQPASTMWAPILVDKHDGPAPVLFDVVHRSTDNHDLVSSRASGALGSPHLVSNSPTARLMSSGGAVPGSPSSRAAAPMKDGSAHHQRFGLPMGTNASTELANLTLYWDEATYVDELFQCDPPAALMHVHTRQEVFDKAAAWTFPMICYPSATNAPAHQAAGVFTGQQTRSHPQNPGSDQAYNEREVRITVGSRPQTTYSDQSSSEREVRITFESIHRNSARVPNFRPASAEHGQQRKWLGGSHLTSETDLSGAHSVTASQDSTFKTPASHALSMVEQLNQLMGRSATAVQDSTVNIPASPPLSMVEQLNRLMGKSGLSSPTPSGPNSPQHERPKSSEPSAVPSLLTSQSVERHVTFGGGTNQSAKASHRMSRASKGRFGTISVSLGAHNEHCHGPTQPNPSPSRGRAPMKIIALEKEASLANKEALPEHIVIGVLYTTELSRKRTHEDHSPKKEASIVNKEASPEHIVIGLNYITKLVSNTHHPSDSPSRFCACLDSGAHNEHRNGSPQPNPSPSRASAPMKIIALEKEASLANKEAGIRKKQMEAAEANRAQVISDFQAPKVAMWASHQGSKIYEDLFPSFGLPDGSNAYMYRHRKTRVDEVQLFVPELGYDENLNSAVAPPTEGVQSVIKDILRKLTELPIEGRYPVMKDMGYPPRPAICALPDLGYLSNLKSLVKAKEDAPGEERDFSLMPQFRSWEHEHGRVRRKASAVGKTKSHQATALSFADGIFDCDWNSCSDKSRYNTMISKAVGKDPSGELLEDLKHQLRTRYAGVVHVFDYYAALHSDSFSMGLVTWGQFAMEAGIAAGTRTHQYYDTSPSCKLADLDRIFLIANFEEDKTTESADANPDKALMRFEFLEALIRTAYAKYLEKRPGKGKKKLKPAAPPPPANPRAAKKAAEAALEAEKSEADAGYDPDTPPKTLSEACIKLIDRCIMPHAPPESLMDKRMFRGERMYTMDVDILLQHNRKILEAIFNHYKNLFAQSDSKRLDMPEWLELMHDCSLFHRYFNQREAKIAFVWSRLRYYDEVTSKRSYQLSRSLSFIEFLEALGRIADMISFPPPDELVEGGYDPEHPTWDYIKQAVDNDAYYKDSAPEMCTHAPKLLPASVGRSAIMSMLRKYFSCLVAASGRNCYMLPVIPSFPPALWPQVVEVMLRSLMFKFGARDMEQLKIKLKAQRSRAYQMGKSTM